MMTTPPFTDPMLAVVRAVRCSSLDCTLSVGESDTRECYPHRRGRRPDWCGQTGWRRRRRPGRPSHKRRRKNGRVWIWNRASGSRSSPPKRSSRVWMATGRCRGLSMMAEMWQFWGTRARVFKRVDAIAVEVLKRHWRPGNPKDETLTVWLSDRTYGYS